MTIVEIKDRLCEVWEILDKLQEETYYQELKDNEDAWDLHEAIGCVDNCIEALNEKFGLE